MTREEIDALVAKKYPNALASPLARLFREVSARDEAERAIEFAELQAKADEKKIISAAYSHAEQCLNAIDGWGIETLGHNIESAFPELDPDVCDEIAADAIAKHK